MDRGAIPMRERLTRENLHGVWAAIATPFDEDDRFDADTLRTIPLLATPREAIAHYQALADAGMQYFLAAVDGHDTETVRLLAEEVMPAVSLTHPG